MIVVYVVGLAATLLAIVRELILLFATWEDR